MRHATRRAAPATSRSGTGPAGGASGRTRRPRPSSRPSNGTRWPRLVAMATLRTRAAPTPARVRPRQRSRTRRTSSSGCSRTTSTQARTCFDALLLTREGAADRAAARLAARRRRLPAADRARARRASCARRSLRARFAAKCEIEPEEHTSTLVFGDARRSPGRAAGHGRGARRRLEATLDDGRARARADRGAAFPPGARSSTSRSCPPRPGSTRRTSRSRRAAIPGQEPIARLHYRGHANRELRVLDVDGARARRRDPLRRQGRRPRDERRRRASRSATSGRRCPTTPSSTSPVGRATSRPRPS